MSRRNRRIAGRGFATALVALLALLAAAAAEAQTTITVNSLNDPSSSRNCTLRDAINVSQGVAISPDVCATTGRGSPYTIVFSVSGTISLSSTLPTIVSPTNLTITGPSPTASSAITIDGGGNVQLMVENSGATLSLNSLTLSNGLSANSSFGGAIFNDGGTLNVANCTFTSNLVTAPQSTFSAFGGAIENDGILTVTGSTFSGNTADGTYAYGGAIDDGGIFETGGTVESSPIATIVNSTFSGDQADGFSGAGGGGVNNSLGTLTLINVTFSDNSVSASEDAGGGAISAVGGDDPATVNLKGTIAANSTGGNCYNSGSGTINDNGYNIADDSTCGFTASTSKVITPTSDIGLASALGANGGPTQTIALNAVSGGAYNFIPALDCTDQSGNPLTTDQRGYGRPVAGTCSAGAYQYLAIDCSNAAASTPNLISVPFVFYPESITGVSNKFKISITDVEQSGPIINFPPLFCPNAQIVGSTAFVRASTQSLTGDMLYSIGFEATDKTSGASCTGSVPVCVQNLLNAGKPCTGTATNNALSCK